MGVVTTRVTVVKGGVQKMALKNPLFLTSPVEPRYWRYLTFEGISVDESGKQHFLDPAVSFRNAVLNAMAYLQKLGYSKEQVRINVLIDNHLLKTMISFPGLSDPYCCTEREQD